MRSYRNCYYNGLASALVLLCHLPTPSYGFPMGAGSCNAGTDALLQPGAASAALQVHGLLMQVGTGPLVDYGLALELDGEVLDPTVAARFVYGEDHLLTLKSTGSATFTGFLVRMGSTDGARTLDSIKPITGENDVNGNPLVRLSDKCQSVNFVGGVTQQNALPKSQVNMTLFMETTSANLELDVTVVIKTNNQTNISQWYYNRYILDAVNPADIPDTPAPVDPTQAPAMPTAPTETGSPPPVEPTDAPVMATPASDGGVTKHHLIMTTGVVTVVVTMLSGAFGIL